MDCFILLPVKLLCRALVLSVPIITIGVFVASIAADAPRSLALNVTSAIAAVCFTLAYIIFFSTELLVNKAPSTSQSELSFKTLHGILRRLMRPTSINIALLHSAAIVLLITLGIRLDATDNFGGNPANLDFGLKGYGDGENVAFTQSSSTVGHFVQGVLASLLSYPAVAGLIARLFGGKSRDNLSGNVPAFLLRRPRLSLLLLCDLASACMTIYPFYSLVKRFMKYSTDFARTSHMNNATEWVVGYVVGVSLGWLVTVWLVRTFLRSAGLSKNLGENYDSKIRRVASILSVSDNDVVGNVQYGFGVASEYKELIPSKFYGIVSATSSILLVLLSMTSFLTGIFIGLTWNYQEEELVQKVNRDLTVSLALLWVIVTFLMTWFASKKWPFNFD